MNFKTEEDEGPSPFENWQAPQLRMANSATETTDLVSSTTTATSTSTSTTTSTTTQATSTSTTTSTTTTATTTTTTTSTTSTTTTTATTTVTTTSTSEASSKSTEPVIDDGQNYIYEENIGQPATSGIDLHPSLYTYIHVYS